MAVAARAVVVMAVVVRVTLVIVMAMIMVTMVVMIVLVVVIVRHVATSHQGRGGSIVVTDNARRWRSQGPRVGRTLMANFDPERTLIPSLMERGV